MSHKAEKPVNIDAQSSARQVDSARSKLPSTVVSACSVAKWLERNALMGMVWSIADADTPLSALAPSEAVAVEHAVASRRWDFRAGRHCARQVLSTLGLTGIALPAGQDRMPSWPTGVVGSITHTRRPGEIAIAVAAPRGAFRSIGVDIEAQGATARIDSKLIASKMELAKCPAALDAVSYRDAVFSTKEAAYKALYPLNRRVMNFREVELSLDGPHFVVEVLTPVASDLCTTVEGVWGLGGQWTLALAWCAES